MFGYTGIGVEAGGLAYWVAAIRESVQLVRTKRDAGKTLEQVKAEGVPDNLKPFGEGFNRDLIDALSLLLFDLAVQVKERQRQLLCQLFAPVRFTATHEANEK